MLISSYKLLLNDPGSFFKLMTMICAAVIIAVTVHEFSHARIARTLGDRTAQHSKRLTLNPVEEDEFIDKDINIRDYLHEIISSFKEISKKKFFFNFDQDSNPKKISKFRSERSQNKGKT